MHSTPIILGIGHHPLFLTMQQPLKQLQQTSYIHITNVDDALERIAEYTEEYTEDQSPLALVILSDTLPGLHPENLMNQIAIDHPACQMLLLSSQSDASQPLKTPCHSVYPLQIVTQQDPSQFSCMLQNALFHFQNQVYMQQQIQTLQDQATDLKEKLSQKTTELLKKNIDLLKLSTTDTLTQLPNRLKLDQHFSLLLKHSQRYQMPLSIMLLDLDNFKHVNDTYGHQVGDEVLIELAERLSKNSRETDLVGRWGGEEFLILCPETNQHQVRLLAEKLRHIIEQTPFNIIGNQTASFGIATLKPHDTEDSLLQAADKALYQAKEQGRNRVVDAQI